MHPLQAFDRLDFHDNEAFDQQIDTISAIKSPAAVDERKSLLSLDGQPSIREFERGARLVTRTPVGPELSVNPYGSANDFIG